MSAIADFYIHCYENVCIPIDDFSPVNSSNAEVYVIEYETRFGKKIDVRVVSIDDARDWLECETRIKVIDHLSCHLDMCRH
tara:strand:- start:752 stop:994 length:243 start_codon:yes stop_codon:yes gene_type:complete